MLQVLSFRKMFREALVEQVHHKSVWRSTSFAKRDVNKSTTDLEGFYKKSTDSKLDVDVFIKRHACQTSLRNEI
jgi:hypothetical protein